MSIFFKSVTIFILSVFLSRCEQDRAVLMKINYHSVLVKDFYHFFSKDILAQMSSAELQRRLSDFTNDELMLFDAHKLNMHKDTNWRNELSTYKKNSLIEGYLQKTVLDSIISENYLLHVYAGLPPEFRNAHPYSKYRQHLYEEALNDKHDAIQYSLFILFDKMILENKLVFNDSVLTQFVRAFKESRDRQLSLNVQDNTLINILNDLKDNYKIASTKNRSYSSDWFKKEVISRKINFPYRNADSELFKDIFKMLIVEDIIYHKALKSDLDNSKDFVNKYNDYKRSSLLSFYTSKKISDSIIFNDDSLFNYYFRNKDSLYLATSRAEIHEIFLKDSLLAVKVLNLARRSRNFYSLAAKYTERFRNQEKPGYLGYISSDQYGGIGKIAQKLKPGEVYDKLIPSGNGFSIIRSVSYIPPEPKPFESVKSIVAQNFYDYKYSMVKDSLINTLKEKYRVRVFYNTIICN